MTMQPARGPGRMPNPAAKVEEGLRRDLRRMGALVLAEIRMQSVLLQRLVELGEHSKAALDGMDPNSAYSVKGLQGSGEDSDSPFIGG